MKKTLSAFSLALSLIVGQQALANNTYYSAGLEAHKWNLGDGYKYNLSFLTGKAGYQVIEGIYLEGKLGIGATNDSVSGYDEDDYRVTIKVEPKLNLGGFVVFQRPFDENLDAYAKIGLNMLKFDLKGSSDWASVTFKETETEFAVGAGINYFFNEQHGINLELLVPSMSDFGDVTAFSLGYIYRR